MRFFTKLLLISMLIINATWQLSAQTCTLAGNPATVTVASGSAANIAAKLTSTQTGINTTTYLGGNLLITEACQYPGFGNGAVSGGTQSAASIPSYLPAAYIVTSLDDFFEITNIGNYAINMAGMTFIRYPTASTTATFTFAMPSSAIIEPNSTIVLKQGAVVAGFPDVAGKFYNMTTATGQSSGAASGYVLKSGTTVLDAVAVGATYSFAAGTGVTTTMWTSAATIGSIGSIAGGFRNGTDNNTATGWRLSNGTAGVTSFGVVNAGIAGATNATCTITPQGSAPTLASTSGFTAVTNTFTTGGTFLYDVAATFGGCTATGGTGAITVNVIAPQPPVADFTSSATTGTTGGTITTFILTDASTGIPTSWNWSFTPSSVTYVGGTSANSQNPQVQFTAAGTYTVALTATNAQGSDTKTSTNLITVSTVYCTAVPTSVDVSGITNVVLGTLSNPNVSTTTYQNFTTGLTVPDLSTGTTPSIDISFQTGYTYGTRVFIDFNQDGDFTDAGENMSIGTSLATNPTTLTGMITIPGTATLGNTRMRVIGTDVETVDNSCYSGSFGNVEDYTVNIIAGTNCSTVAGGTTTTTNANTCPGINFTLGLTGQTTNVIGLTYEWQQSPDNTFASPVVLSSTTTTQTINQTVSSWYRCKITCVNGGAVDFSAPVEVTTPVAVTAFYEDFDAATFTACWSVNAPTGSSAGLSTAQSVSPTRSGFLAGTSTAQSTFNSIAVSNIAAGGNRVRFKAYATTATISLQIGTAASPGATFNLVETKTFPATAAWNDFIVNVPNTFTGSHIVFRILNSSTTSGTIYVDNVYWEPQPTCNNPIALATTSFTATSATIGWTAPSPAPADGYEYYYSTVNIAPTGATTPSGLVAAGVTTTTITGLTPNTLYYYWVRSSCSAADKSPWVGNSVYTGYCIAGTVAQTSWISVFTSTGGSTNMNHTASAGAAGGYLNLSSTDKISNFASSNTPITLTAGGPTCGFAVWIDWNNNLIFETTERVYATSVYTTTTSGASITVPTGTVVGNYMMRVFTDYNNSAPSNPCSTTIGRGEYKDFTFEVTPPPSCLPASALTATAVTGNSATLSWADPNSPVTGSYDIELILGSATATGTPTANVTTLSYAATGLSGLTTYKYYVRANCAAGATSWAGPFTFTTSVLNNNIANAIDITGLACSGAIYSNQFATLEVGETVPTTASGGCWSSATSTVATVWFKFTAPASGLVKISTDHSPVGTLTGFSDTEMALYSSTAPTAPAMTNISRIACNGDGGTTDTYNAVITAAVTPNAVYFVQVAGYGTATGTFCIDVTDAATSATAIGSVTGGVSCTASNATATGTTSEWITLANDISGQVVMAINTNGQNLGNVTASYYVSTTPRSNANSAGVLTNYLDRNWSISSTIAPTSPVSLRLYMTDSEFAALNTANVSTTPLGNITLTHVPGVGCSVAFTATGKTGPITLITQTGSNDMGTSPLAYIDISTPSFSSFYAHASASPLPITLKSFTATEKGAANVINWETAVETNVRNFAIEKSNDAKTWTKLGEETPSTTKRYSMIDNAPFATTYYRLRNIDNDSREDVSNVVVVNRKTGKFTITSVSPNPTNNDVNLKFETTDNANVTINVQDIFGRVVLTQRVDANKGFNTVTVSTSEIPAGAYFLNVNDGTSILTQRIVKN